MRSRINSDFSKFHYLSIRLYLAKRKCVVACYEHLSNVVLLTNEQLTRPLLKSPDETCRVMLELN